MLLRPLIIAGFLSAPCVADIVMVRTGPKTWKQVESLSEFTAGKLLKVEMIRIITGPGDPDDPDDPDDPNPSTLRGKVKAAAEAARDPGNAANLRNLYGTTNALIGAGLPLLSAIGAIKAGTDATLNTAAEKAAWNSYLNLTNAVLSGSPVTKQQLKDIELGLTDAAGGPAVLPSWLHGALSEVRRMNR